MYRLLWACVLAVPASSTSAQQSALQSTQQADSLPLTRARAIALARLRNPQLEVVREQTAQFKAQRVQAVAIPDPAITASLDNQPSLFRSAPGGQKNVGALLDVPFPDKFRLRNNVAVADVKNSEAAYNALEQQIVAQTSAEYDSLLVAQRHRVDFMQADTLARDFLKRTQARFDAGTTPKLDVIRAQVDVARATNDLIANERDIITAASALNRLIARPQGAPISVTDTLAIPADLPALDSLMALAMRSRPELAGLSAERAGAKSATTLAKEFWLPDVTLGFSRDVTPGTPPGVFSTGLAFPIPLLFWQHTRGEISQAQHHERELAASYRDLENAVGQDVRTAYANANTALRQAIYIRDELLPSAVAAYRSAAAAYAIGGSSAFDVIDARRTLLDAQTQYADAIALASTSHADLERAIGAPLASLNNGTNNAR